MSLIYEALRKSEEQRRLGETPTLSTPPLILTRRRRRNGPAIALVSALLGVSLAAWWLLREPGDESAIDAAPTRAASGTTSTAAVPAGRAVASPPAAATATPAPVANEPPAPGAVAQAGDPPAEPFANSPAQRVPAAPTAAPGYVPPEAALPEPLPDLENDPVAREVAAQATAAAPAAGQPIVSAIEPGSSTAVPVVSAPAPPEPVAAIAPPEPPAAAIPEPEPAPAAAPAPPAAGAVPYLFELPVATRRELPALKLNMHVWSADPARRFVIVDGTRAPEGGALAPELTVAEIRNDGVVLEFRGTRFLLLRSGG